MLHPEFGFREAAEKWKRLGTGGVRLPPPAGEGPPGRSKIAGELLEVRRTVDDRLVIAVRPPACELAPSGRRAEPSVSVADLRVALAGGKGVRGPERAARLLRAGDALSCAPSTG